MNYEIISLRSGESSRERVAPDINDFQLRVFRYFLSPAGLNQAAKADLSSQFSLNLISGSSENTNARIA